MKKLKVYLLAVTILSILPILILFSNYYRKQQLLSYNFKRSLINGVRGMQIFDLKYNSFYLSGNDNRSLYLGNTTAPLRILKINSALTGTQLVKIDINEVNLKLSDYYRLQIDSSHFYIFNGVNRSIYQGKTGIWKASVDPISRPYFQLAIPISTESIAFRYISNKSNQNSLRKESRSAGRINNDKILEKQVDGLFCTDGVLTYNSTLKQLIYVYYYRNQILLIDTNLNLLRKMKTIDPVDTAKFKVSTIKSSRSTTFSSPALLVNGNCSSWGNYLFVQSKLMGKHEDETSFKNSSVIDIYDLKKYSYLCSLYLPNFKGHSIRQFKVIGDSIFALSDRYIIRYTIQFPRPGIN